MPPTNLSKYNLLWVGGSARTASIFLANLNWCDSQPLCRGNLGIPRREMPQIRATTVKAFVQYAEDNGVKVRKTKKRVRDLHATQREINGDVVEGLVHVGLQALLDDRPMLASEDGYILDGHHRWAALLTMDPEQDIDLLEVQAPVRETLALARSFPGVEYSMKMARWGGYAHWDGMTLRTRTIRLAATLPHGSERTALLQVLARSHSTLQNMLNIFRRRDDVFQDTYANEVALSKEFFSEVQGLVHHGLVKDLINAFLEYQDTDSWGSVDYKKMVQEIVREVSVLGDKYLRKFDPEVLRDIKHGHDDDLPNQIWVFVQELEEAGQEVEGGHAHVPLFLNVLGVPMSEISR